MYRSSSDPQRGGGGLTIGAFLRASSIRLSGYLADAFGRSKRISESFPKASRSRLFYGYCKMLGGQVRIKVERSQLVFKLIDHVKGGGGGGGNSGCLSSSPRLGLLHIFAVSKEELLEIKFKSATSVKLKLMPGVLYGHLVRLGLLDGSPLQGALWRAHEEARGGCGRLVVQLPPGTLAALVDELKASRFARKTRYGFLGLRSKLVPFRG